MIKLIYEKLLNHFGHQGWWPLYNKETGRIEYHKGDYSYPKNEQQSFEISIGAILTQNTSWKNVEKALKELHENNVLSRTKIESLSTEKLAILIKSSGYHNQKARKIKEFLNFNHEITRENLLGIWGIGPETADSILLYAYKQPVFVIDAYTKRIMMRLSFPFGSYKDLQEIFHSTLPKDYKIYNEFHALFVEHAKVTCKKEPLCSQCSLKPHCTYGKNK